ncbi:hypothetical protein WN943_000516 [Citrus x changshan-huyou]
MISLYDHHNMPDKTIETWRSSGVTPDEDTVRRIGSAFQRVGQDDKQKLTVDCLSRTLGEILETINGLDEIERGGNRPGFSPGLREFLEGLPPG